MVLEQHGGHAGLIGLAQGGDMVQLARMQRGAGMDMQIDRALHQIVNATLFGSHRFLLTSSSGTSGAGTWLRQT